MGGSNSGADDRRLGSGGFGLRLVFQEKTHRLGIQFCRYLDMVFLSIWMFYVSSVCAILSDPLQSFEDASGLVTEFDDPAYSQDTLVADDIPVPVDLGNGCYTIGPTTACGSTTPLEDQRGVPVDQQVAPPAPVKPKVLPPAPAVRAPRPKRCHVCCCVSVVGQA